MSSATADVAEVPADAVEEPGTGAMWRPIPAIAHRSLVAIAVAVLTVLAFARFGLEPRALVVAFAAAVLTVLAAIDIEHRLLPNRILLPATAVVLAAQLALRPQDAVQWLLAGLCAAAFLALPLLVRRDAMGMGDIKLALLLGACVGWGVFGAIVIGCLAMVPVAVLMLGRDGSIRGATLPFGPFLALGTIAVMFASAG